MNDDGSVYEGETSLKKIDLDSKEQKVEFEEKGDDPLQLLAQSCGITKEQLKKVIDYTNGEFIFTGNIVEPDFNKRRAMICQCILTAWMKGKGLEWIESSVLIESLRKLGIETRNMIRSMNPKEGFFRTDGQKSGLKYALTIPGWKKGLEILKSESERV